MSIRLEHKILNEDCRHAQEEQLCPTGIDNDLLRKTTESCAGWDYYRQQGLLSASKLQGTRQAIHDLVENGASVRRSHALHAAVYNNAYEVVVYLLELEPGALNGFDDTNYSPLMMAAASAARRTTENGIAETLVLDHLLACGANRRQHDEEGMTAYGIYVESCMDHERSKNALFSNRIMLCPPAKWWQGKHPTIRALQSKLRPPGWPSAADLYRRERPGIINLVARDLGPDQSDEDDFCVNDRDGLTRKRQKCARISDHGFFYP